MTQLTASRSPVAGVRHPSLAVESVDNLAGMAKEVTLNLPDDVAGFLDRVNDPSAFVADAVRGQMMGEVVRQQLLDAGFNITEEGVEAARAEMERIRSRITPELRAKAADLYAEVMRLRAARRA